MTKYTMTIIIIGVLLLMTAGVSLGQDSYRVANLRLMAGDPCDGAIKPSRPGFNGINAYGDVCGSGYPDPGTGRPYYYDASTGVITNLGDLAGDFGLGGNSGGVANGLNDWGVVVGRASDACDVTVPFVWFDANGNGVSDAGEMKGLVVDAANPGGEAYAVNNAGQVVFTSQGVLYLWTDSNGNWAVEANEAVAFGTGNNGYGLNEQGAVVWYVNQDNVPCYYWQDANGNGVKDAEEVAEIPATVCGGDSVDVSDINDLGQVCGYAKEGTFDKNRGYVWTDLNDNLTVDSGEIAIIEPIERLPLDVLSNVFAWGINNKGEVVGGIAYSADRYAFIWDAVNGTRDLNDMFTHEDATLGSFHASQAYAINDAGQITAFGRFSNDSGEYCVVLTPIVAGDFNEDARVNLVDYGAFMQYGYPLDCSVPGECDGRDFNDDGVVDMVDLASFCNQWLVGY